MTIGNHITKFAGKPVKDFKPGGKPARGKVVYRLALGYEDKITFAELLDQFLAQHDGKQLTALVIGPWNYEGMLESSEGVVEALVGAKDRMPNLKALFYGDITYEECEMSWINHGDVSPLLPAFPKLEEFRIRGASDLSFGKLNHPNLKSFAIESGGLPSRLLNEVWEAKLPKLEHLELWLGSDDYGGIHNTAPLKKLLSGTRFPKLKYLGLRNSEIADEVAKAVAKSAILKRVQTLDLSLGNIGDEGAKALMASPAVKKLKLLDLHHHFISNELLRELKKLKVKMDVSGQLKPDTYGEGEDAEEYRYITVAE